MEKILLDNHHFLTYQYTPWNDLTTKGKSVEIESIQHQDDITLQRLVQAFDDKMKKSNIQFVATRVNSNDNKIKKALLKSDFYITEHSLRIQFNLKNSDQKYWESYISQELESLSTHNEVEQIKLIAKNDFFHGRFHEDPFIDKELAANRNVKWIESSLIRKYDFLLFKNKQEVIAFLMLEPKENKSVELYFGGSKNNSSATPKLMANGLNHYKKLGYHKLFLNISSSNLGMINIIGRIGGKAIKSLFGYHKFYNY